MIPSKIAELVLEGHAEVKNFCGGLGAVQTLLVPQNKQVILLNLTITTGQNFVGNNNFLHLAIDTDTTKNYFSWIMADTNLGTGNKFLIVQDMFIKSKKDIRFRYAMSQTIATADFNSLPPEANEPPTPIGYGQTQPVLRNIKLGDATEAYLPVSLKYDSGLSSNEVRNEVFPNISNLTAIPDPGVDITQAFLCNVQYVIINDPATNKY